MPLCRRGGSMPGLILLIPFFLVRFGLLSLLNRDAVPRAAHFAPLLARERGAYWVYQISNAVILLYPILRPVRSAPGRLFVVGLVVYVAGLGLLAAAVASFAAPAENGINKNGLYRVSRNPMYVAYFIFFLGCVLLLQSPVLLGAVLLFQVSAHWIIRSEERWCLQTFGGEYQAYMKQVRRYL